MSEIRRKHSELQTFVNRSQNSYHHSLKNQIQRIITLSFITYFSSFSSFKILHRLLKSFVIPTPNRVYSLSEHHFLKKRLKKLEKLKELEKLEIRPTSNNIHHHIHQKTTVYLITTNRPYRYNSLRRDGVSPPDVHNSCLQERIIRLVHFLDLLFCRRGMPKWHSYR